MGSRTGLVMRIVHSRRPLALASPSREFAITRATLSGSQADLILFLLTKPVREPSFMIQSTGSSSQDTDSEVEKCYLSNFGSFFPLHNFSSNRPRAACRGDKHHPPSDEPCRITFPRLYCPFSWPRYRTRKTETGPFLLHNFSFLAVHGAS